MVQQTVSSIESTEGGYQWFEHGASTKAGTGKGAASSTETRYSLSYWAVGTDLELVVLTERHRSGKSGAYQPSLLLLPTATPASIPSPCPRHGHDCSRRRNQTLVLNEEEVPKEKAPRFKSKSMRGLRYTQRVLIFFSCLKALPSDCRFYAFAFFFHFCFLNSRSV
ncbi:hypothetical protein PAHAL_4G291000 [Panicum hallii]|uniref:Uncharacterized protein n=1 Tax=Panicum hallii TaxID=206008 RepID=A0A2T8JEC8_9POAL|nr:hypothetical protein PAHAL_4G291000 [Panicum hallii]